MLPPITMNFPLWLTILLVLLGALVLFAVGAWLGQVALLALKSGVVVSASQAEYKRAEMPALYWLTLSLKLVNAAACLLLGLALLVFFFLTEIEKLR